MINPTQEELERIANAMIAEHPGRSQYEFTMSPDGEFVLERFSDEPSTRRSFTQKLATIGIIVAIFAFFLKAKHALAYQCGWYYYGSTFCGGAGTSCPNNRNRATYIWQRMRCCTPDCHWTDNWRLVKLWCGC